MARDSNELASLLGEAVGNLQNVVGAVELLTNRRERPQYLQDRLDQAKKFLKEEDNGRI